MFKVFDLQSYFDILVDQLQRLAESRQVNRGAKQRVSCNDLLYRSIKGFDIERGLRGLIGPGASQVSISAAMRTRDAARPTEEDLARAEAELEIVRRGWQPREPLR